MVHYINPWSTMPGITADRRSGGDLPILPAQELEGGRTTVFVARVV